MAAAKDENKGAAPEKDPKSKKVDAKELAELQAKGLLVGYDPATGIAVVK